MLTMVIARRRGTLVNTGADRCAELCPSAVRERMVTPVHLAGWSSIKGQVWLQASRTFGKRSKGVRCSYGPTGLWISADEDNDGDAAATQPVLKRQRWWTSPVGRWLARSVDDGGNASVIRQHVRET